MKNRIFWYIVVTFVVSLLVTGSVLMPGVLLSRTEDSILDSPSTVSTGISFSQQQNATAASKTLTPSLVSVAQMTRSVQLYEQGVQKSVLSKGLSNGSMDMKEAVDACVQQITTLLHKSALVPLHQFPKAYIVQAEQRTIMDDSGNPALQYWDITFVARSNQPTMQTKISVSLDAQTGMFLSMRISAVNAAGTVDLMSTAEAIAQGMHMPGRLLLLDEQTIPQTAAWKFNNAALLMQLTLEVKEPALFFTMSLSSKP
ncbi:hypothetical protein [Ktedonobacter racemifer]|uniref:Uncharacterized protein n=1 Tax=Ktedonobacter racemifer DSM 44963 TaxID=485913 RepID=D6U5S7_KTERA|nr:hypothetical protein [Ktedonobacter racemifer]EFH80338.1 hypothetical protein Krac_0929 [Ktedonobacter racemifer DSM 44963]